MDNLGKDNSEKELGKAVFRKGTKSNQGHLLGLPFVAPNALPVLAKFLPLSSNHSVIKGPYPTLVV